MTNTRSTRSSAQGSPQKQEDVEGSSQQPPPFLTKTCVLTAYKPCSFLFWVRITQAKGQIGG
jgi:hypothetical protein